MSNVNEKGFNNNEKMIPGVPKCFNYGIYFDDDYDYTQHLKSLKEFLEDPDFSVIGDVKLPEDYCPPEVQPVETPLVEDFEIPSDDDMIEEQSDLEDNFVELAGGVCTKNDHTSTLKENNDRHSSSSLTTDKVKMMERFLFGTESAVADNDSLNQMESENSSLIEASSRTGKPPTDREDLLEKQFDMLMRKTKSRSGFDGQSLISGTSVMSEGLQSIVQTEDLINARRKTKMELVNKLDSNEKSLILKSVSELPEPKEGKSDPLKQWLGPPKPNVGCITSSVYSSTEVVQQPFLKIPHKSTSVKPITDQLKMDSTGDEDQNMLESDSVLISSARRNGETAEEKRNRKNSLKMHRRDRRMIKKYNKTSFRNDMIQAHATGQVKMSLID